MDGAQGDSPDIGVSAHSHRWSSFQRRRETRRREGLASLMRHSRTGGNPSPVQAGLAIVKKLSTSTKSR